LKKYLLDTNTYIYSPDMYAKEKARLRKSGTPIDDFDLIIGVTSVTHNLTMVTNNSVHFERIGGIVMEDWTVHYVLPWQ